MGASDEASETGLDARIAHAFLVERILTTLGWFVLVIGFVALVLIAWQLSTGELDLEQAAARALGTALATVLSGATAYGSGTGIGLAAARLDLSRPDGPSGAATAEHGDGA